jgi:signal peptidase I
MLISMKKLYEIILVTVLVLLIALSVTIYSAPRFGWTVGNILSGSMSPTLESGTMVIAQKEDPGRLKIDDIIIYKPVAAGENDICHRITGIASRDPLSFITKGDNYPAPDPLPVPAANVVGKVVFEAPLLGNYIQFQKSAIGLTVCLIIPAIILVVACSSLMWQDLIRVFKRKMGSEENG